MGHSLYCDRRHFDHDISVAAELFLHPLKQCASIKWFRPMHRSGTFGTKAVSALPPRFACTNVHILARLELWNSPRSVTKNKHCPIGPRTIWIDSCPTCERATRVEPRLVVPRSRGVRSSSNLRYSFPLGDINPDHGRREVYTVGKTAR